MVRSSRKEGEFAFLTCVVTVSSVFTETVRESIHSLMDEMTKLLTLIAKWRSRTDGGAT